MNKFAFSCLIAAASAVTLESHLDCNHDKLPELVQVGTSIALNDEWISTEWSQYVTLNFKNVSDETVQLWWYDWWGREVSYG